jgi:hypothetical protein
MNFMELECIDVKSKFKSQSGVGTPMKTMFMRIRETLRQPRYALITGIVALSIFLIPNLLVNARWLEHPNLIIPLLQGVFAANATSALVLQAIIAVLSGITVSLMVMNAHAIEGSALGISGMVASIVSGGCSACGASLLPLVGLSGALAVLPFKGKELYLLGISLLFLSIYRLTRKECNLAARK